MLNEKQIKEMIEHYEQKYRDTYNWSSSKISRETDVKLNFLIGYYTALKDILNNNFTKDRS